MSVIRRNAGRHTLDFFDTSHISPENPLDARSVSYRLGMRVFLGGQMTIISITVL